MVTTGKKAEKAVVYFSSEYIFSVFYCFLHFSKGFRKFSWRRCHLVTATQLKLSRICLKNQLIWEPRGEYFCNPQTSLGSFKSKVHFGFGLKDGWFSLLSNLMDSKLVRGEWGIHWSLPNFCRNCLRLQNLPLLSLLPYADQVNVDKGMKKL